jgi:hypothetical protein
VTHLDDYSPQQALARDLLIHALNGGASVYWAHVHGVTVDCPPEQVRAEGIHVGDRSVWSADLDDITRAVTKLIEHPDDCAERGHVSDSRTLPYVSATLAAARAQGLRRVADLAQAEADYSVLESHELIADVVFQVAVYGEVIR